MVAAGPENFQGHHQPPWRLLGRCLARQSDELERFHQNSRVSAAWLIGRPIGGEVESHFWGNNAAFVVDAV